MLYKYEKVSIHALVKRATFKYTHNNLRKMGFNPRPREEGDCELLPKIKGFKSFNPRPREEGDHKTRRVARWDDVSIPALVKRATSVDVDISDSEVISIHALVKRATPFLKSKHHQFKNFNPRPREEGD